MIYGLWHIFILLYFSILILIYKISKPNYNVLVLIIIKINDDNSIHYDCCGLNATTKTHD